MQEFEILESDKFKIDLEDAALWHYSHNLEQSQDFADQKFIELEQEINGLKSHLRKNPRIGQTDEISGLRRFPVYEGRYLVTWAISDNEKTLTLLEFIDSKYPKQLREIFFDD
jgi:hypothetical protein